MVVPASSPSSPLQNPRSSSFGFAAGPGALPARVEAILAALPKRLRGAPQPSPEKISLPQKSLRSPGFGRHQVPCRALRHR
eukprot:9489757-Pyramimonas_sp.AAC.1